MGNVFFFLRSTVHRVQLQCLAISSEIELEDRLLEKEQEEQCESSDEDDTEVASGEKAENRQIFKELNRIVVQDRLYLKFFKATLALF